MDKVQPRGVRWCGDVSCKIQPMCHVTTLVAEQKEKSGNDWDTSPPTLRVVEAHQYYNIRSIRSQKNSKLYRVIQKKVEEKVEILINNVDKKKPFAVNFMASRRETFAKSSYFPLPLQI